MLQLMRKNARNWMMKVILAIIIVVFVFYFGSMKGNQQTETIAEVDGTRILYSEFVKEYENLLNYYQNTYGDNLSDKLLKKLKPKEQALNNLINQTILLKKTDEFNLQVSDEELQSAILAYPAFHKGNTFDPEQYQRVLNHYRMTPEDFEDIQRKTLKITKLERLIKETVKVSEEEAYHAFRLQNEEINVNFIQLPSQPFENKIQFSDEELEKYLNQYSENFRVPKKVKAQYIVFAGKDFINTIEISDEAIAEYYEIHKKEFNVEGGTTRSLSDVKETIIATLKLRKGNDFAYTEAKQTHDIIYQEENFEAYAQENKLRIVTTPFFEMNNLPKELTDYATLKDYLQTMEEGEITPVLTGTDSFAVARIVAAEPSYIPALSEIRDNVAKSYKEDQAIKLCREKATSLLNLLKQGKDFDNLAKEEGLKIQETGFFIPQNEIPKIGFSIAMSKALYELSENALYPEEPYYANGNYVILKFKEKGSLDQQIWENEKAKLTYALLQIKEQQYFQSWLDEIKQQLFDSGKIKISDTVETL